MFEQVRVGILGCANIAKRFLIPAFQSLDEYNLVGIASRNQNLSKEFSEKFSIQSYKSYDQLITSKDINAIYIPLPNGLHYEWVKKSLNNNLHVLVEKSLACNYRDVLELTKLAKTKNLVLMENFQFRFHSQLAYIKNLIDSGEIGMVRNVRSSFGFPPLPNQGNIRYNKELGGGALLDAGAYPLKIVQMFMSKNAFVACSNLFIDDIYGVDTFGSFQVNDEETNVAAQCAFGFDNFYQCNLEIWGSKGILKADRIFTAPPDYTPTISLKFADGDRTEKLASDNHFNKMLMYFFELIRSRSSREDEYDQNLRQAKLLEQVRNTDL